MEAISEPKKLILSICMPTYNRLKYIQQALSPIINQIDDKNADAVEILISNNASSDNTEHYIKEVIKNHPKLQIKYFCQTENIGAERNIYYVTNQAKGDWLCILSDDDVLLPGAIDKLLTLITNYPNFDAFCLNMYGFNQDSDPHQSSSPVFNIADDVILKNKDDALALLWVYITFLSVLVFRRDILANLDHSDKIGTFLRHSYIYLDSISKENGIYITKDPFIATRGNNSGGYDHFKVFVSNFADVMTYAKSIGYSNFLVEKILHRNALHSLLAAIVFRKLNGSNKFIVNDREDFERIFNVYSVNFPRFLSAVPVMVAMSLPTFVFAILKKIFIILKIKRYNVLT